MSKITKSSFKISGMHCTACALNIDFELEDLAGVTEAKTSYAKQELTVKYDPQTNINDILKAIEKVGYTAELMDKS